MSAGEVVSSRWAVWDSYRGAKGLSHLVSTKGVKSEEVRIKDEQCSVPGAPVQVCLDLIVILRPIVLFLLLVFQFTPERSRPAGPGCGTTRGPGGADDHSGDCAGLRARSSESGRDGTGHYRGIKAVSEWECVKIGNAGGRAKLIRRE